MTLFRYVVKCNYTVTQQFTYEINGRNLREAIYDATQYFFSFKNYGKLSLDTFVIP